MMATSCPIRDKPSARAAPTRPHPITTTCTTDSFSFPPPRPVASFPAHGAFLSGRWRRRRTVDTTLQPRPGLGITLVLVSKLTAAARRLVLGRPVRSDRLAHTLLPKRIALPVFASDAL